MFPPRDLNFKEEIIVPKLADDGSNQCDFYRADVLGSKKFVTNYGGWPRSDLALINEQTDLGVAKAMAAQLVDFNSDAPNSHRGMFDTDIILQSRSKYCQAPAEQLKFIERQISERDARIAYLKQLQQQHKEQIIDFTNDDVNKE